MSQYALPIRLTPIFSEDNFFVSASNEEAHQWIMSWPEWPAQALILYGPSGSGKSHLAHIWAEKVRATTLATAADALAGNALLEHIEEADERSLLHLINRAKESSHFLLFTSSATPKALPFTLPDLTSRLLALPTAEIHAPDDAVLAAALRKQFSDRQLKVEEEVIAYLLPRMERSFAHISETVEQLDREALSAQKNITVPFARRALGY
jgi:chromosomal replication initiation ATPase DnaA